MVKNDVIENNKTNTRKKQEHNNPPPPYKASFVVWYYVLTKSQKAIEVYLGKLFSSDIFMLVIILI